MRELYTLELIELVGELKSIEGMYVDQFYELGRNRFRFKLSRKGEKANLLCILPCSLNRTDTIESRGEATNFALAMRKRIAGAKIKGIEQLNNDRIIAIKLEKRDGEFNLVLEMFGRGNMVLAANDMKILLAYQTHEFKDRIIKPNATYKPPKNEFMGITKMEYFRIVQEDAKSRDSETTLVNRIGKKIGIGTMYIKEAARRSKIMPDTRMKDISMGELEAIVGNLEAIIDECLKSPKPVVYKDGDSITNFALCDIGEYSSCRKMEFKTFESCLDYVSQNMKPEMEQKNEEEEKLLASMEKQMRILKSIESEIKENKAMGDYIINNMHELNSIINAARSKKESKEELQRLSDTIEILSINMKTKSMRIKAKDDSQ